MRERSNRSILSAVSVETSTWTRWVLCLGALIIGALPLTARANELEDLQQALSAYEAQNYQFSATLLEALVGGEQPRLQNRALVMESRKYLAASYLFLGRSTEAEQQYRRLLQEDPSYQLDPMDFPEEVQAIFKKVRQELEIQRRADDAVKKLAEEEANRRKTDKESAERAKMLDLIKLAETESVERVNSRWIALIPFGVGQFQNGDAGWGIFFSVFEGVAAATAISGYFLHEHLKGQQPKPEDLGEARFAEKSFRYANQISLTLLAVAVIAGIIDAQARFHPLETTQRPRQLPEDLRESLKISKNGGDLLLTFTF